MCLLALALSTNDRFPLVLAANRDEFFARPASPLSWWTPNGDGPDILSGRDLLAGGTWLGLTAQGRLAMLTNVRNPALNDPGAPSRGLIVQQWLSAQNPPDHFWARVAMSGYNGFNLIAADFRSGECFWGSNIVGLPRRLERGLYGLSNARLDTPWPKVVSLKNRVADAITMASDADILAAWLFEALADPSQASDDLLPNTGVPKDLERQLSACFIRTPDGSYGTRCSTLIINERQKHQTVTHVFERTFSATGETTLVRRSQLTHWPPQGVQDPSNPGQEVQANEVWESEWPAFF